MYPVLYSFRRCPYAIRARLAIKYSGTPVELREVILANKPREMLNCSPKGTVPVLQLTDGNVLEESMDIINWALNLNDPDNWAIQDDQLKERSTALIQTNDDSFKKQLDYYKYASRFPEHSPDYYRDQAGEFLQELENQLDQTTYLLENRLTIADIAIFPFIRQFAFVDKTWFDNSHYRQLQNWLNTMLDMKLFKDVMGKYSQWNPGDEVTLF